MPKKNTTATQNDLVGNQVSFFNYQPKLPVFRFQLFPQKIVFVGIPAPSISSWNKPCHATTIYNDYTKRNERIELTGPQMDALVILLDREKIARKNLTKQPFVIYRNEDYVYTWEAVTDDDQLEL